MNVGNVIFEQLKYNMNDLFVWGSTSFKTFNDSFFNTDTRHLGGLVFKVRGLKHKGHVMIRLDASDTYVVSIGVLRKGVWSQTQVQKDVYVDELHSVIDSFVEGTKNMTGEEALKTYEEADVPFFKMG